MVFRIDEFKDVCNTILAAVDSSSSSILNETLELKIENNKFVMAVTNREYYVKTMLDVDSSAVDTNFHATVNATIFLRLIAKLTTDVVDISVKDKSLVISGNGSYKIPMIYDGDNLLTLPPISVNNPTITMQISGNMIADINKFNIKLLSIGSITDAVQKLCYIDEKGSLTFTRNGGCINRFNLSTPVQMLIDPKVVKFFEFFVDKTVDFSLGHEQISNTIRQTIVEFRSDKITVSAILTADTSMYTKFPDVKIRDKADAHYDYVVTIHRNELLQAVDRLLLFPSVDNAMKGKFSFSKDSIKIYDSYMNNCEEIYYTNSIPYDCKYDSIIYFTDLKKILNCFNNQYVTISFGNKSNIVISAGNVSFVIAEAI